MLAAIGSARHSIWMTQLAFDADCQAYGPGGEGRAIVEALIAAAVRTDAVDVRILLNATLLLNTTAAAPPILRRTGSPHPGPLPGSIEVRG